MSKLESYRTITAVAKRLRASFERRKKDKEIVSYELEPIYDDGKIEVRAVVKEGLPELIFSLDIIDGKPGKDISGTGLAGE